MATVGYATLQVIPSFKGFAGIMVREVTGGTTDAARRIEGELTDAGAKAGQSVGQRVRAGLEQVRSVVTGIAGDIVGLGVVAGGIGGAIAANANKAQIQAALGVSPAEAQAAAQTAGALYAKGWGDSLESVSSSVVIVKQQLGSLAGGADIEGLTARAETFSKVFGVDTVESVRAVAQMVKTGLAPNAQAAYDILTAGAQKGLNANGDLLDTYNEYGVIFQRLGLDGPRSLGLINQAMQAGARNTDLVADALKEFSVRAQNLDDPNAQAGLKALGLNAKQVAKDVAGGGEAAQAALQKTLDKLGAIKDPAKQATLAAQLFGSQGEDLAGALFALDPATAAASGGFDKVAGASGKAADAIAGGVSPVEQFKRSFQQTLSTLAAQALPTLQPIMDWLQRSGPEVARVAIAFAGLVAVNKAVGAVRAVAGGIRDTVAASRTAASAVATAGRAIGSAGAASGRAAVSAGRWAAAQTASAVASTRAAASAVASRVATVATAAASRTAALATTAWTAAMNSSVVANARAGVAMVASRVAMIAGTIATGAATAATWLLNAAMAVLTSPITAVVVAIALLVAGIIWAWNNVDWFRAGVLAAWEWIKTAVTVAVNVVRSVITTVWGAISAYITTAVAVWRAVIDFAWAAISNIVTTYVGAVRAVITTVVGWITTWWRLTITGWKLIIQTVWSAIVNVVQVGIARVRAIIATISAVIGVIRSAFSAARDAAVSRLESLLSFVRGLPGKVTGALGGLRDKLVGIGRNVVQGLRDGIAGAWHLVTDQVASLVNKIPLKIRQMLGIASPSKVMRRLFGYVGEGAALGVGDGQGLVERAAARLARAAQVAPLATGQGQLALAGAAPSYSQSTTYHLHGTSDELWGRVQAAQRADEVRQRRRRPY
ncbi:phage tail tape measure protein [Micromonospora chalcea]|uniref:phage tail tape measure protein n=1 Tax=Micromonospora chalcea TaxID=1874 RepID=UPI002882EB60|nr:phage tail tape measure protein [Micromonospora chalcea]